jgi:sporadic carbohydrate cluster 2OG-Fe(II) oxygenase
VPDARRQWIFDRDDPSALSDTFLRKGIVKVPVEDRAALDAIRETVARAAADWLGVPLPADLAAFLNTAHERITIDRLNDCRLRVISSMNNEPWLRPAYAALARRALETLVGNELAMQRQINLSIQLPHDAGSLLPVHSDVWAGDSPYEVVLWVPYVDCARTKSMFFCDAARDAEVQSRLDDLRGGTVEDLYTLIEPHVEFIDIAYGEVLVFTQNILHGNRVNLEPETRWSSNCRFKSLLSPYADKKLGEFFEPISIRPATRLGLRYRLPELSRD